MRLPDRKPQPIEPSGLESAKETGFPRWAHESLIEWLTPFLLGWVTSEREFPLAVERTLHVSLDWQYGARSAASNLERKARVDGAFFVSLVDFALRNIFMGYEWRDAHVAALRLDRILTESGSDWRVHFASEGYSLERRMDAAADAALAAATSGSGPEASHMLEAWRAAFGQSPNPSEAYRLAIKAVEDVAIPVVLPNDPSATLGKVLATLRDAPGKWQFALSQPVGPAAGRRDSILVVIDMLGLLWQNQTDRHGTGETPVPITQAQAEVAVNVALALLPMFRGSAVSRR